MNKIRNPKQRGARFIFGSDCATIWFESTEELTTPCFWDNLEGKISVAFTKKRVLVVDDDPQLLQLVRVLLARAGIDVLSAEDADAARLMLIEPDLPDLLVLDIMLPDVSGIDFLRELRDLHEFDDLPILMLSALIDPAQIREALDAGADRYLTKPYVANSLVSIVEELLRTGRP